MSNARIGRASPKLAALAGGALDGLVARPRDEERAEVPPPLPTRRERLAAAAEAFAFLRSKMRDERTSEAVRVRIATTLIGFVTDSDGWFRMPGEARRTELRAFDVADHPWPEGQGEP